MKKKISKVNLFHKRKIKYKERKYLLNTKRRLNNNKRYKTTKTKTTGFS